MTDLIVGRSEGVAYSNNNLIYQLHQLQPHKCPVCNGNGKVDNGFYGQTSGQWSSTSTESEQCRSCKGEGIVWG